MRPLLLLLTLASAPALSQPAPAVSEAELVPRLTAYLDSLDGAGAFSGVVALGRGGEAVFARAYGAADREAGVPNSAETAFNLGSINKLFTAIAVRQLAAEGRIQLDSTLASHWPDYPNPDVASRVTVRQLLEHRSGIGGDVFAAPPGGTRHDLRHNRDFLPLFVHEPLRFEPGADQRYSNAGFVVLGALVERVSGEDYYDYVRRHVYEPAGMTRSGHLEVDALPPETAQGYTAIDERGERTGGLRPNAELLPGRGSAAGGGYATAGDLLRLLQALRERRVAGGVPPGIGAAGGSPGVNAVIEGDLPGGYDLVVLANLDPPAAEAVARRVRGWLDPEGMSMEDGGGRP